MDSELDPHGAPLAAGEYRVAQIRPDGSVDLAETPRHSTSHATRPPRSWQGVGLLGVRGATIGTKPAKRDATPGPLVGHETYQADWLRQRLIGRAVRVDLERRRLASSGESLALIYLGDQLINEELLRSGWARCDDRPGDSSTLQRRLHRAEQEARRARRGVWGGD